MQHILLFCSIVAIVWFAVIYFLPGMVMTVYKRAILVNGFGEGPVEINTLYTQSREQFADPLHSMGSRLTVTGVNRDTIITIGWLDLCNGPLILHVPDMSDRYYSVQLTNPSKNTVIAYVGKRTTGAGAGAYIINGPGRKGGAAQGTAKDVPQQVASMQGALRGAPQIRSPSNSILIIGRVLVYDRDDLPTAYNLSKQLRISVMTN